MTPSYDKLAMKIMKEGSKMIRQVGQAFYLHGKSSSYAFCVNEAGHLEHLHFGARIIEADDTNGLQEKKEVPLNGGGFVIGSLQGSTGSRNNSFVMLSDSEASEEWGDCYRFHLIYSGNHYESLTTNAYGKLRFLQGIHPTGFTWELLPEASFESPEAVMTYSDQGYQKMSHMLHHFITFGQNTPIF